MLPKMYVIRFQLAGSAKIWESERYADNAKAALATLRKDVERRRLQGTILGVADVDGGLSLQIVGAAQ